MCALYFQYLSISPTNITRYSFHPTATESPQGHRLRPPNVVSRIVSVMTVQLMTGPMFVGGVRSIAVGAVTFTRRHDSLAGYPIVPLVSEWWSPVRPVVIGHQRQTDWSLWSVNWSAAIIGCCVVCSPLVTDVVSCAVR